MNRLFWMLWSGVWSGLSLAWGITGVIPATIAGVCVGVHVVCLIVWAESDA